MEILKRKKGFTLTEILVTLIILGIIMAIAIPTYKILNQRFKENYYNKTEDTVNEVSKIYIGDNKNLKPVEIFNSTVIDLNNLVKNKYIDKVLKYNSNTVCNGYSVVIKDEKDYIYQTCLNCEGDYITNTASNPGDYCNGAWKSNNYIEYSYEEKTPINIYCGSTQMDLQKKSGIRKTVIKKDESGRKLKKLSTGKYYYPKNLNGIDLNKTGNYKLKYEIVAENRFEERNVNVYKHPAPKVTAEVRSSYPTLPEIVRINEIDITLDNPTTILTRDSIALSIEDTTTFSYNENTKYLRYEYFDSNDNKWKKVNCTSSVEKSNGFKCRTTNFAYGSNIKFRIIADDDGKEEIGEETQPFDILRIVEVKFQANGASSLNPTKKHVIYNDVYSELATTEKSGYIFTNWMYEGEKVLSTTKVTTFTDHTLIAGWKDTTLPVLTVSPSNSMVSKKINIKIDATDNIGLNSSNEYKYYLSTSKNELLDGSWINYTNNSEFNIGSDKTGTYYLFIKRIKDTSENESTENGTLVKINSVSYHRFGPYIFDNSNPTVPTSNLKYEDGTIKTDNYWTNKTLIWTDFNATDVGPAGIDRYEYSFCDDELQGVIPVNSRYTYDETNFGSSYCIRSVDKVGNHSDWSDSISIYIDKISPTINIYGLNIDQTYRNSDEIVMGERYIKCDNKTEPFYLKKEDNTQVNSWLAGKNTYSVSDDYSGIETYSNGEPYLYWGDDSLYNIGENGVETEIENCLSRLGYLFCRWKQDIKIDDNAGNTATATCNIYLKYLNN